MGRALYFRSTAKAGKLSRHKPSTISGLLVANLLRQSLVPLGALRFSSEIACSPYSKTLQGRTRGTVLSMTYTVGCIVTVTALPVVTVTPRNRLSFR